MLTFNVTRDENSGLLRSPVFVEPIHHPNLLPTQGFSLFTLPLSTSTWHLPTPIA